MKSKLHVAALAAIGVSMLAGCAAPRDRFDRDLSQKDYNALSAEAVVAKPQSVMGVDIWKKGVPNKKYVVLGIVTDKRKNAGFDQTDYDQDVAKFIKSAGGDAGILLVAESKVIDKTALGCGSSIGNSSTTDGCPEGDFSTFYSANIEGTNGPLEYRISHIVIIKYMP